MKINSEFLRLAIFFTCLGISVISSIFLFYDLYARASDERLIGNIGYVSDEVWYADASRTLFRIFFGINTQYIDDSGYTYYTILFNDFQSRDSQITYINETLQKIGGSVVSKFSNSETLYVYKEEPALLIKVPKGKNFSLELKNVRDFFSGYPYADVKGIFYYYNFEHPPLGKYLIGLSLVLNGDKPISWRLPSVFLTSLLPILLFFIVSRITEPIGGAIASLIPHFDKLIFNEGFLALLDVYLAFFVTLSLLFAVYNRYILSAISIGLASSVKLPGFFLIIPLYLYLRFKGKDTRESFIISFLIPFLTWIIVYSPLMLKLGIYRWILDIESSLRWHTTSRPAGPPTSLPWEWIFNANPFYFHINPTYSASVSTNIYLLAIFSLIFALYLTLKRDLSFSLPALWFLGIFLGFILIVILGNRTLYSFYVFALAPSIYACLATYIYSIFLGIIKLEIFKK